MSREQLDRLRFPLAIILVVVAGFVLWPREPAGPAGASAEPSPSVLVGEPGGDIIPTPEPTPEPTPIPTVAPVATPTPTPTPEPTETAAPAPADGFTARVLACRSIDGPRCNGPVDVLPANASAFTALVLFTDANAGDLMNAVLDGPSGTFAGTPYALQGGGDGYFWAEFQVRGLPSGPYVLTATRNGQPVATTAFTKGG